MSSKHKSVICMEISNNIIKALGLESKEGTFGESFFKRYSRVCKFCTFSNVKGNVMKKYEHAEVENYYK